MKNEQEIVATGKGEESIVCNVDGFAHLEMRSVKGVIWLTMQQIAIIFDVDRSVIGKHIRNIYKTGELEKSATWAKIAQVRLEGARKVTRETEYYSLDVIIAVGYRVNSIRATRFRIWATNVLKRYLQTGTVAEDRIGKLEKRMSAAERSISTIICNLIPALPENRTPIGFNT